MGVFVLLLHFVALTWSKHGPELTTLENFLFNPMAWPMILCLLGVAITGGMFVVPLYAFLTADNRSKSRETARTVAANNIVNSGSDGDWSASCLRSFEPRHRSGWPVALGRSHVPRFRKLAWMEAPSRPADACDSELAVKPKKSNRSEWKQTENRRQTSSANNLMSLKFVSRGSIWADKVAHSAPPEKFADRFRTGAGRSA